MGEKRVLFHDMYYL